MRFTRPGARQRAEEGIAVGPSGEWFDRCKTHCRGRSEQPMTVRHDTYLADGRELFYYDREPGTDRSAKDARTDLPPAVTSSQMRCDPLFEEYAVIAGHR